MPSYPSIFFGLIGLLLVAAHSWGWYRLYYGALDAKLARNILLEPTGHSAERLHRAWLYLDDQFAAKISLFVATRAELVVDRSGGGERSHFAIRELEDWLHDPLQEPSLSRRDQVHLALAGWYCHIGNAHRSLSHLAEVSSQDGLEVQALRQRLPASSN